MSYQAGRPENVLRRAEDLIAIDQSDVALQNLFTFITSKRAKHIEPTNPQLIDIFKLFISLAIDKRFSKDIKDALYQYKKMIQGMESKEGHENLELLTKYFLTTVNSKLDEAQSKANVAAEVAIEKSVASAAAAKKMILTHEDEEARGDEDEDDFEEEGFNFDVSPEDILLSSVTTDDSTDRSNKEFFLPWLKFVWEAYRTVLELLKNNNRLETAYCHTSLEAFQFCLKYDRKAEFKRLCELLKTHLLSMTKAEYDDSVNLSNPDTLHKFLDTRFQQLNTAVKLELWKESFKSIEDVHGLMKLTKRAPKPIALINYYNNLAKIFQVSNDYAYSTAARQQLFQLLIQSPVITPEQLKQNASLYVISALSVAAYESFNNSFSAQSGLTDSEFYRRKNNKLALLLNLNQVPTRESLLNSSAFHTALTLAEPTVVELYKLTEKSFNPLTFHTIVDATLKKLVSEDKYLPFAASLKEIFITKILAKVSTLYDSIKFDFLHKISSYETEAFNYDEFEFEDLLVSGKYSQLIKCEVEIDDAAGVVNFTDKVYVTPTSKVNSRLFDLEKALSSAIKLINVEESKTAEREVQNRLVAAANEQFEAEKESYIHTAELIQKREAELKALKLKEAEELEKQKNEQSTKHRRDEEERIKNEAEKREQDRLERLKNQIALDNKKKIVQDINASGLITIKFEDVKNMSEDEIRQLQIQKLEEQSKKLEEQSVSIFKRIDYIERAQRTYEIPMLEKDIETDVLKQKEEYTARKEKNKELAKKAHDEALQVKERLSRFVADFKEYNAQLDELNKELTSAKQAKAMAAFEAAKQARIAEYIEQKKQAYLANVKREQEEARARAEADKLAAAQQKIREEAAEAQAALEKKREEAAKARREAMEARRAEMEQAAKAADPERQLYEQLKDKDIKSLTFSEKMKLKVLAKKFGN